MRPDAAAALLKRLAPLRRLWTPLLIVWFVANTYARLSRFLRDEVPVGQDARIYYRAVSNWLAGVDPWSADVVFNGHTFSYAGTPATVVLMAPAALISEDFFTALLLAVSVVAAVWVVRRLGLPAWWLLFPPIVEILYSGNPHMVVFAALLAGGSVASVVASSLGIGLKVYALVPVLGEGRVRRAVAGLALTAATFLVAPNLWLTYLQEFGAISARLADESDNGFSAFYYPLLLVPVGLLLILLAVRDRRTAGWLAVPALWPASEFHYSTFALPVMSPLLAVLLAFPGQQVPPIAIGLEAARRLVAPRVTRWVADRREPGPDFVRPIT